MDSPKQGKTIPDRTLVIMAKAPRLGSVKTRLAQTLPSEPVTELYRCMLQDTITLARSLAHVKTVIMCPASDVQGLVDVVRDAVEVVPQNGGGLAAGLTSVFARFATGANRVVAFNSDTPHLPATILENAFEALASHDVMVGPTEDGGYYLVGCKAVHPGLFDGDSMGTTSALDALLARARRLQLSAGFTLPFYDIDIASDLSRLAAELESAPDRAPQTAVWLRAWRPALEQLLTGTGDL